MNRTRVQLENETGIQAILTQKSQETSNDFNNRYVAAVNLHKPVRAKVSNGTGFHETITYREAA